MSNKRLLHGLSLLALLCATSTGSALTIGRQQGQAVLGRPLEVQVPVGLDPGMDAAELCPEAEVSYGEARLPPRMIDVQVTGSGEATRVLVRAIPPLEEPFATVQLRVGCSQRLARRFVLLAEEPMGLRTSAATVALPALADALLPARPEASVTSGSASEASPAAPGGGRASSPSQIQLDTSPVRAPASAFKKTPVVTSRLRLDPVDYRPQASDLIATSVSGGPALSGEDIAARHHSLEAEVRKLQVALNDSHAVGAAMRGRLVEAQRERYANPVVFGLAVVSALSLLLAGWVWRRAAAGDRSRFGPPPLASRSVSTRPPSLWPLTPIETVGSSVPAPSQSAGKTPAQTPDKDAVEGTVAASAASSQEGGKARSLTSMNARMPEPLRLSTHELNDIQQEADFFVSLGEHDRAIDLLRHHIEQHPQGSALAWLDLLAIQHQLGRRDDYEQVRRDFEWLFNAKLPAFDAFDSAHDDLEGHPELMARIQAAWPAPAVLKVIDSAIFRTPVGDQGKPLGLQAYRDLLFLYQLAHNSAVKTPEATPTQASTLDLDLDAILAHPTSAPDPTRSRVAQERFAQGLDALINFNTKVPQATEPKMGLVQDAAWGHAGLARRRTG